jgi:hypothetical protein
MAARLSRVARSINLAPSNRIIGDLKILMTKDE